MHALCFHSVTLERFGSFRKRTTISFGDKPGFKFVTGRNMLEPRLGSNGSGKSTIFEAITWCLYGATSSGDRAAEVVTWNEKLPSVTVCVCQPDGSNKRYINRTGSPNRLIIDDEIVDQLDVDRLIGLNKSRFLQTVMFGQGAPLFFDLSVPGRGELLDEVFAISYWLDMAEQAAEQEKAAQRTIYELEKKLAHIEGAMSTCGIVQEASLVRLETEWNATQRERLDATLKEIDHNEHRLEVLRDTETKLVNLCAELPEIADVTGLQTRLRNALVDCDFLQAKLKEIIAIQQQYEDSAVCPTCGQPITAEFTEHQILQHATDQLRLTQELRDASRIREDTQKQITEVTKANIATLEAARSINEQLSKTRAELDSTERLVDVLVAKFEAEQQIKDNPYTHQLARIRDARRRLEIAKARASVKRATSTSTVEAMRFWKQGFRRVRLFLLKQVLDSLTIEIAAAAASLGLSSWKVVLTTETETKGGSVKSGVQIVVSPPDGGAGRKRYSGGEHQRIKLAVSIGLANMIQRMAGIAVDFEIWDEPTQFLSEEGINDLLECLAYRAQSTQKSIYLLDHRSLNYGFDETIFVEKTHEGSRIRGPE